MSVEKMIREKQGTIIDVRTPEEFYGGKADGAVNIPLHVIEQRLGEIKNLKQPIVLCCASGARSAFAAQILKQHDINCFDAGSWMTVNYYQSQTL
jgi:rhodanese-related sulfurtransferase